MRNKGIIIYGTEDDRNKLAVLAKLANKSGSEFLIDLLRSKYTEVLGDIDPKQVTTS